MSDLLSLPEPTRPTPPRQEEIPSLAPTCARCQGPLSSVSGLSWCQACGYCPSLDSTALPAEGPAPAKPTKLGASEFAQFVGTVPPWLAVLLGGVLAVVGMSIIATLQLAPDSQERAVWCLAQLGLGLLLVVAAHVLAIAKVPSLEVRCRARGHYTVGGLWRAAIGLLPQTRWPVYLFSWGLSLVLTAVAVIGGLTWWVTNVKLGQ